MYSTYRCEGPPPNPGLSQTKKAVASSTSNAQRDGKDHDRYFREASLDLATKEKHENDGLNWSLAGMFTNIFGGSDGVEQAQIVETLEEVEEGRLFTSEPASFEKNSARSYFKAVPSAPASPPQHFSSSSSSTEAGSFSEASSAHVGAKCLASAKVSGNIMASGGNLSRVMVSSHKSTRRPKPQAPRFAVVKEGEQMQFEDDMTEEVEATRIISEDSFVVMAAQRPLGGFQRECDDYDGARADRAEREIVRSAWCCGYASKRRMQGCD